MSQITVIKRDGRREPLAIEKWQAQIAKVCQGIPDVSSSMIEIKSQPHFYNGITTREIDNVTLRAIADLINPEHSPGIGHVNYQYVAGRWRLTMLRKDVYGQYQPPRLYEIVRENVAAGMYTDELLAWYTEAEWDQMEKHIDHEKDEMYSYSAIEQLAEKYLVRNRVTGRIFETPQVRYMVAAATVFHAERAGERLKFIKEYYTASSDGQFTLATPVLAGLGTPTKQFSSCVLIKVDDTLDSIFASGEMMAKYASKRAGIGVDTSRIRSLGSPIRNGEISHTGAVPFYKKLFYDLRSCCLRPDMWVEIASGETSVKRVQMQDVKVGMMIKTMTPSGEITFRQVTHHFDTPVPVENQVKLVFENGVTIHCSTNHPIVVLREGQQVRVDPMDLSWDDQIISDSGFTKLSRRELGGSNDPGYLDITVDDTHLFFTSDSETGPMILTKNSQGGIRNSSATVFYQIWHREFETLIRLKNNQGTEETRVRHLDYGVVLSAFFWRRFKNRENITLFDPNDVPDLYEAFYRDSELFEKLYVAYEANPDVRKITMSAEEVFKGGILKERTDTGRIYLVNIDNVMKQGPFDPQHHTVYQSNLCCVSGDTHITLKHKTGVIESLPIELAWEDFSLGALEGSLIRSQRDGEVSWEPFSSIFASKTVDQLIKVTDSTGNSIRVTDDHRVYTENRGYVEAGELFVGDMLRSSNGEAYSVTSLETVDAPGTEVYDVSVPGTECFYANDILVHNCEILLPTVPFQTVNDEGEFKLTLDDGREVTLPGEHLVLLSDGSLKGVRRLTEEDDIQDLLL